MYLFARAGCQTNVYDADPTQADKAIAWLHEELKSDRKTPDPGGDISGCVSLVTVQESIEAAVRDVGYVQESGPEQLQRKQEMFRQLDESAAADTILGSSTSTLDMSAIARELKGARRCIVAHPVNPPHVVPVVELLPGRDTSRDIVDRTREFLTSVGQEPVVLRRYVHGFVLNRLQVALIREAIDLVVQGVADVNAVDAVVRDGLGLRWALMGPFGVGNTNADGGLREYFSRYREALIGLMNDLGPTPSFDPAQIELLGRETDEMLGGMPQTELLRWRDRMIQKLRLLKDADPGPARKKRTQAS
jgi:3-hydroxyacyl-CoA dehydrogenase